MTRVICDRCGSEERVAPTTVAAQTVDLCVVCRRLLGQWVGRWLGSPTMTLSIKNEPQEEEGI